MSKLSKQSMAAAWTAVRGIKGQDDEQSPRKQPLPDKMMKFVLRAQHRSPDEKSYIPDHVQDPILPQSHTKLSGLESLPTDILYLIASILPSEAVYSLSLTSRTLSRFFSRSKLLSEDPLAKKHFLLLLENDRPDHLVCYTCNRLYRWRISGSRKIRLCPGRQTTPHHDYGRLDIKSHSKRVPRELVDLTLRGTTSGRKHGTTLKRLTKSLQEKESLDRHLRMRAHSYVLTSVINNSLLVTMVFGVRIPTAETTHPLYWLATHNLPHDNNHILLPPAREFRHPRLSTLTRLLGCNSHEFLMFDGASHSDDYAFLACADCKSSIRVARNYYFNRWVNVKIETTQAFGTRDDLAGDTWCYAGLTREHRKQQPDEVIHFMRCLAPVADQPAFASQQQQQLNGDNHARDIDLSLNAWFNRHVHVYSQRIWARADDAAQSDGSDDDDDDDDDEEDSDNAEVPVYPDDAWDVPGPSRVTQNTLSIRKRWFEYSMIGLVACIFGPAIIYREVKNALSRSRNRAVDNDGGDDPGDHGRDDDAEIAPADSSDGVRPAQDML